MFLKVHFYVDIYNYKNSGYTCLIKKIASHIILHQHTEDKLKCLITVRNVLLKK